MLKHQEQQEQTQRPAAPMEYQPTGTVAPDVTTVPSSKRSEDVPLSASEQLRLHTFATAPSKQNSVLSWPRRVLNIWQHWKGWQRTTAAAGTVLSFIAAVASLFPTHTQATAPVDATTNSETRQWQLTPQNATTLPRSLWMMNRTAGGVDYFVGRDELYQASHGISTAEIPVDLTRGELKPGGKQWRVTIEGMYMMLHGFSRGDANQKMTDFTSAKVNNDQHPVEVSIYRLKNSPVRATLLDQSDAGTDAGVVETLSIPAPTPKTH